MSNSLTSTHLTIIAIAAVTAGIGFFDYMIFVYLNDVLSELFFIGQSHDWFYEMQLIGLFVLSCLAMPLGGFLIGEYADDEGRKPAFGLSVMAMGVFTFIIGLLPTDTHIGVLASFLFILAKLGQGMAFGGLIPTIWVYLSERLPNKSLGLGLGVVTASSLFAVLLLLFLVLGLENYLSNDDIMLFGWRIPFLLGGAVCAVLYLFVRRFSETPVFLRLNTNHDDKALSIHTLENQNVTENSSKESISFYALIQKRLAIFLPAITLSWLTASLFVVLVILLPDLISTNFILDESVLNLGVIIGITFMIIGCVVYGFMADFANTAQVMLFGGIFFILQILLFFGHLTGGGELILVFFALLGFSSGIMAVAPMIIIRLFPTRIRATYTCVVYNIAFALISTLLPFILGFVSFYFRLMPAMYLVLAVGATVFISFYAYHIPQIKNDNYTD